MCQNHDDVRAAEHVEITPYLLAQIPCTYENNLAAEKEVEGGGSGHRTLTPISELYSPVGTFHLYLPLILSPFYHGGV